MTTINTYLSRHEPDPMATLKRMHAVEDALRVITMTPHIVRYLLERDPVVRLHLTDIIETLPDGRVRLNSGGWKTVTTKDRFNKYTPYRVWSDKGTWYVHHEGAKAPFFDGMLLPDAINQPKE